MLCSAVACSNTAVPANNTGWFAQICLLKGSNRTHYNRSPTAHDVKYMYDSETSLIAEAFCTRFMPTQAYKQLEG
jgi:hypothetical protein